MRTLAGMTTKERSDYLNLLVGATREIVPRDAEFAIVLFGADETAHWVASTGNVKVAAALRALADSIERMNRAN